jgi:hypothetical protein
MESNEPASIKKGLYMHGVLVKKTKFRHYHSTNGEK